MLIRIPPFRERSLPVDQSKSVWAGIKGGYEDEDEIEEGEEDEGGSDDSDT